jgi:hypothetical protein
MFKAQEMAMKKLMTVAALATVLASPALAQSYDPDVGSGNIVRPFYAHARRGAYNAFARVYRREVLPHRLHRSAHAK